MIRSAFASIAVLVAGAAPLRAQAIWRVDAKPAVVLGGEASSDDGFSRVWHAARLRDGRIAVGDAGDAPLRLFGADGKQRGELARKGSGPGEVRFPLRVLRCADSLYVWDGEEGHRVGVFAPTGQFVRFFRFGVPAAGQSASYATVCSGQRFLHIGWEDINQAKAGTFRTPAPVWMSRADEKIERVVGQFPASERYGLVIDGALRGTRPLPFGRETRIAIGRDRFYIATANDDRIEQFDHVGKSLGALRTGLVSVRLEPADIQGEKERELIAANDRKGIERDYSNMKIPTLAPPYARILVDSEDLLWVQSYPRPSQPMVTWHVYDKTGRRVATVALPTQFEPYDIDRVSILGRFIDTNEAVPQVRVYRLTR